MSSFAAPAFYRLDLAKLGERFKAGVPFSEWCKLCETAGPGGFAAGALQAATGPELTPLQKVERILGTLMYINISGAAGVWLALAGLSYSLGLRRSATALSAYAVLPIVLWLALSRLYTRADDPRFFFPYQHQHLYLHMKYIWPAEMHPQTRTVKCPIIFCIVPHGVLPFGIDYATIDHIGGRICRWVAAPILFKMPFIGGYMKKAGVMPANAQNIKETLSKSENVGIVLDGVAGIFQPRSENQEAAWLLQRKGIVKIALQSGAALVPIYGFGHTSLLTALVDPFKLLEKLSIKLDISIVPFLGRWGLPMGPPRRAPVAMALGRPLQCPLMKDPRQEDIDKYHLEMLDSFKQTFDTHKDAFGWGAKSLVMV